MNHTDNLTTAVDRAFACLDCESTPAELGPLVTADQARILRDVEAWAHDILAARPRITPATEWRTPTEHRLALAANLGAGRDAVGRKPASFFKQVKRRNGSGPITPEQQRAHTDRMNGR